MKKPYNNLIDAATVSVKTYFLFDSLAIPIIVDIAKIKNTSYLLNESELFYKVHFHKDEMIVLDEESPVSLYGKFKDFNSIYKTLSTIYDFIDNETIVDNSGKTILETLKLSTKKEFCSFVINSGILSFENLIKMYNELLFYIEKVKNIFIENVENLLDFKKVFPHISLKPRDTDIPKHLLEKVSYTYGMSDVQSIVEFGSNIIFKENIGKAYEDWSFREVYLRKMYLDLKARTDEYIEKLKCKQMET